MNENFILDPNARTLSYYAKRPQIAVSKSNIDNLMANLYGGTASSRLCLHQSSDDTLHDMLIAQGRKHYFPPKKHPHKAKTFHIIRGDLVVISFDDNGNVTGSCVLSNRILSAHLICRIGAGVFHTDFPISPFAVFHEITTGPFNRDTDRIFAPFAPPHEAVEAGLAYRKQLLDGLPE